MNHMSDTRAAALDSVSSISASTEETYSVSLSIDDLILKQQDAMQQLTMVSANLEEKAKDLETAIGIFKI